jgi:hypothetical protein
MLLYFIIEIGYVSGLLKFGINIGLMKIVIVHLNFCCLLNLYFLIFIEMLFKEAFLKK